MSNPLDSLLLEALSTNDHQKYARVIGILRVEAERVAKVNIPEDSLGAVDYAIDKVEDWLADPSQWSTKGYPFSYAKKIVRTKVIDYVRKHKGGQLKEERDDETALEHQVGFATLHLGDKPVGWEAEAITTQIDGLDFDPEKRKSIPWRIEKLKEKHIQAPIQKSLYDKLLLSFPELNGWGSRSKEARRKRLSEYSNIETLIKNIPSDRERVIVEHCLWSYRNTDIARKFNVGKNYISKVTLKWIRDIWGWSPEQLRQARLSLLTHRLSEAFKRYRDNIEKTEEEWGVGCYLPLAQQRITSKATEVLCLELINAPEPKAYFGNNIDEAKGKLLFICRLCYGHWGT